MTGFGRNELHVGNSVVSIEIKTLNSKFLDAHFRLPNELKGKEIEIRQLLTRTMVRGKVECAITMGSSGTIQPGQLNKRMLRQYLGEIREFMEEEEVFIEDKEILSGLIRLPEIFAGDDDFWNDHWQDILDAVGHAAELASEFRKKEGAILRDDLLNRVSGIRQLLGQVEPFEKERLERLRSRINEQFQQIDYENRDRFEQEMIYYLERLDISEEKTRLLAHCGHFEDVVNDGEAAKGKRLNFVSQEMGREINTMGSKANHAKIQHIVVLMKDELEKIKEQTLNVL